MAPRTPPTAMSMMASVLQTLIDALKADGSYDGMCMATIYPGQMIPLDYGNEECGGMLWVRLVSAFPSVSFPAPASSTDNCVDTDAFQMDVGIMRPSPIPENFGTEVELPTDVEHFNAAERQMQDMTIMKQAIKSAPGIPLRILGTYTPMGPDGGTVGGTWTFTVGNDLSYMDD